MNCSSFMMPTRLQWSPVPESKAYNAFSCPPSANELRSLTPAYTVAAMKCARSIQQPAGKSRCGKQPCILCVQQVQASLQHPSWQEGLEFSILAMLEHQAGLSGRLLLAPGWTINPGWACNLASSRQSSNKMPARMHRLHVTYRCARSYCMFKQLAPATYMHHAAAVSACLPSTSMNCWCDSPPAYMPYPPCTSAL